jgi:hypothetical protein
MPVEEATANIFTPGWVDVPCTNKVAVLVVVPIPTEPFGFTRSTETPLEELI